MFRYNALTNEQIDALRRTVEPGDVYFEVIDAKERLSKEKKIPMLELALKLTDEHGNTSKIYDYLLATDQFAWKIKAFCESVADESFYTSGSLCADTARFKSGKVRVKKVIENERATLRVVTYLKSDDITESGEDYLDDIIF